MAYCPDARSSSPGSPPARSWTSPPGSSAAPASAPHSMRCSTVGLAEAAHRRVGGFSRGMRSRLGLAAGLIGEPQLLIADEPAAALDPAGRWEIIDLLASLAGSMTVLVSSHDLADIERICDRVGVLAKGRSSIRARRRSARDRRTHLRVVVRPPADRLIAALRAAPWVRSVQEAEPGDLGSTSPNRTRPNPSFPAARRDWRAAGRGRTAQHEPPGRVLQADRDRSDRHLAGKEQQ